MNHLLKNIDHILITIPHGAKEAASQFYAEVLQLKEIPGNHPRGTIWFKMGDIQLHIREGEGQQTHSDRHPAFTVSDLMQAKIFLKEKQVAISYSSEIEGRDRCFSVILSGTDLN